MPSEQKNATIIFEDNSACIRLSENSEFHKRTKHIEIQYISGEIELIYINTKNNVADLLTKALSTNTFNYLVSKMYELEYEQIYD